MHTEIYIEALPVDEGLTDQVRDLWNAGVITDNQATWVWCEIGVTYIPELTDGLAGAKSYLPS